MLWAAGQDGSTAYQIEDATDSTYPFTIAKGAPSYSLYINSSGDVGIGTSSPARTFHAHMGTNENLVIEGPYDLASGATLFSPNDAINAYEPLEIAASQFDIQGGNVGIGTTMPAATLDVNGTLHLKEYSAAPAACGASQDGVIALTNLYTLCVCKNGTGWVTAATGSTSCSW